MVILDFMSLSLMILKVTTIKCRCHNDHLKQSLYLLLLVVSVEFMMSLNLEFAMEAQ